MRLKLLTSGLLLACTLHLPAQSAIRLNPDLAGNGDVLGAIQISDDSRHVIFAAEVEAFGRASLYSTDPVGSVPAQQINAPGMDGNAVQDDFMLTPDNSLVVYRSTNFTSDERNLFSVPPDGSQMPVLLNTPGGAGTRVSDDFLITTSGMVIYQSNERTLGFDELYMAPADGTTAAVRITPDSVSGADSLSLIGMNSTQTHVLYLTSGTGVAQKLFAIPLSTPGLATDLSVGLDISNQLIDLESNYIGADRVAYLYSESPGSASPRTIFSARLDGATAPLQITDFPVGERLQFFAFNVNQNASLVVYISSINAQQSTMNVVPVDGTSARVVFPAPDNRIYTNLGTFSPDSLQVVNSVAQTGSSVDELFSFSVDGSGVPISLNPESISSPFVINEGFLITPDSSRVVYRAGDIQAQGAQGASLYSARLAGGQVDRLAVPPVALSALVDGLRLSDDSQSALFLGDRNAFNAPLNTPSDPAVLNAPLPEFGSLIEPTTIPDPLGTNTAYEITPDQQRFVYRADMLINERFELFSVGFPPLPTATAVPAMSGSAKWILLVLLLLPAGFMLHRRRSY